MRPPVFCPPLLLAALLSCATGVSGSDLSYRIPAGSSLRYRLVTEARMRSADATLASTATGATRLELRCTRAQDGVMDLELWLKDQTLQVTGAGSAQETRISPELFRSSKDGVLEMELKPGQRSPTGATLKDFFQAPLNRFRLAPGGTLVGEVQPPGSPALRRIEWASTFLFLHPGLPGAASPAPVPTPASTGRMAPWTFTRAVPHHGQLPTNIEVPLTCSAEPGPGPDEVRIRIQGDASATRTLKEPVGQVAFRYHAEGQATLRAGVLEDSELHYTMSMERTAKTGSRDPPEVARSFPATVTGRITLHREAPGP